MAKKRPLVFIGSSTEGLPVAKAVQANLDYCAECVIWHQGGFGLSEGNLESLVNKLDDFDFAVLVLTPDDFVESRGARSAVPRDNVLLELGLFVGRLGRDRTCMVVDRSAKLKLPSDLAGITPATFQPPESGPMRAAVGAACTALEEAIKKIGKRKGHGVQVSGGMYMNVRNEHGIQFTITNAGTTAIPPYKLGIFHPKRGSYFFFPSEHDGPLLPDQKRQHHGRLLVHGKHIDHWPDFGTDTEGVALTEQEMDEYGFRLVLDHSDKVLYENRRLGKGLVQVIRKVLRESTFENVTGIESWELLSRDDDDITP